MIINLTPHEITVFQNNNGDLSLVDNFKPTGIVARISLTETEIGAQDNVPLFTAIKGQVQNLPDPEPDTLFIVSALVREALPDRKDLCSPTKLIRDKDGNIFGCCGLIKNT